jgi:hypothetical protein
MKGGRLIYRYGRFEPANYPHPYYVDIEAELLNELNIKPKNINQSIDFSDDAYIIKSGSKMGEPISLITAIRHHINYLPTHRQKVEYKEKLKKSLSEREIQDSLKKNLQHIAFTKKLRTLIIEPTTLRLTNASASMPTRGVARHTSTLSLSPDRHPRRRRTSSRKGSIARTRSRSRTKSRSSSRKGSRAKTISR